MDKRTEILKRMYIQKSCYIIKCKECPLNHTKYCDSIYNSNFQKMILDYIAQSDILFNILE